MRVVKYNIANCKSKVIDYKLNKDKIYNELEICLRDNGNIYYVKISPTDLLNLINKLAS